MPKKMMITAEAVGEILAEIREDKNPKTANAIWNALPFESTANRWGDEIYFEIPVTLEEEEGQQEVNIGDMAYWPPGRAFCIFFGPTPVSRGSKPRAASPVNVFGTIAGDVSAFKQMRSGDKIKVEKQE